MVQFARTSVTAPRTKPEPCITLEQRKRCGLNSQGFSQPVGRDVGATYRIALVSHRSRAGLTPKREVFVAIGKATTTPVRLSVTQRTAALKTLDYRRVHRVVLHLGLNRDLYLVFG